MNKRGMSTLIASLILITLCLVALVFVGFTIKNSFNEDSSKLDVEQFTLDLEISQVKILNEKDIEVTVKRNPGKEDLSGVAFVMYDENNSEIMKQDISMEELEEKNFSIILNVINATKVSKISIAPIFKKRFGKDLLGDVQDERKLSSVGGGGSSSSSSGSSTSGSSSENSGEVYVEGVVYGNGLNELPTQIESVPSLSSVGENIPVPHERFSAFSSPESRIYSQEGLIASIVDKATYRVGYYSSDGENWQSKELRGTNGDPNTWYYESNNDWIMGDSVFEFPDSFNEEGENYVALYTCHKKYVWLDQPWDCHGEWQLIVVNGGETDAADPYENVTISDLTCGNSLDYQCGTRTICGETLDYGTCSSGYDCNNNLCIAEDDLSCSGVTCESGEYCSRGVCLLNVPGNTYFVALWGNDSNNGTYEEPFYSWQQGAEVIQPGDIVYIRGGVWYPENYIRSTSTLGINIGTGYTEDLGALEGEDPIKFYNYPGEKPILDGSKANVSKTNWLGGISIGGAGIHLRGLTVRHIHQKRPDFYFIGKPYSEVGGIGSNGANHYFENVVVHDIDGRGFQHWSYAWSEADLDYGVEWCIAREEAAVGGDPSSCTRGEILFQSDDTSWINSDAYNLFDRYASEPGNAADGWKVGTYYGSTFTWKGSRAWNYSDDGFDPHGAGFRIFEDSWASSMNVYAELTPMWGTEGNGFKTTGARINEFKEGDHGVVFKNCIAANNYGHGAATGFIANLGVDDLEYSSRPLVLNSLSYYNYWGYSNLMGGKVHNNIVYGTRSIGPTGEIYNIIGDAYSENGFYEESNNTWDLSTSLGWPPSHISPEYNVTDEDFVSLDYTQLQRPRKADGSLPDITFGRLAEGSDLIDSGVVVPGYHCPTAGSHPGEDCREWYGSAPDLGPFESNY